MAGTSVAEKKNVGIASYLGGEAVKAQIASIIGEKNVPTFVSSVVSAVQTNKTLAECTKGSIVSGALLGESLKLTPSPQLGQYFLVPYDSKDGKQAQFQIGYRGYVQLAIRSGQYEKIVVSEVKEGECDGYNPITEEFNLTPITDMVKRAELPTIGYYGMIKLVNGYRKEMYWTKEQMEKHADTYSAGYRYDKKTKKSTSFWTRDFDAMAKKTLLRQMISKWGVMSVEMQTAYNADMAVLKEDGTQEYIDNPQDTESKVEAEIESNANSVEFQEVVDAEVKEVVEN